VLFSAEPGKESEIVTGKDAGTLLGEWLKRDDYKALGSFAQSLGTLPFTISEFDTASQNGGLIYNTGSEGSAFLFVLSADENAKIWFGTGKEYDDTSLEQALNDGSWQSEFEPVDAAANDIFSLDPGAAYVIEDKADILLFQSEVALGETAEPEEEEETEEAVETESIEHDHDHDHDHDHEDLEDGQGQWGTAGENGVFALDLFTIDGALDIETGDESFDVLVFLDGSAVIDQDADTLHAAKLDTFFIPAGNGHIKVTGNATFALARLVQPLVLDEE
jgi:hypothetical protein